MILYPSGGVMVFPTATILPSRINTDPPSITGPEIGWIVPPRSMIPGSV